MVSTKTGVKTCSTAADVGGIIKKVMKGTICNLLANHAGWS